MHKIALLTDIHANLPALEAALSKIQQIKVDEIVIGGDSIGIGPFPCETLIRIMKLSNISFINGNHELVAIHGISSLVEIIGPNDGGYLEHAKWCNSQLSHEMVEYLKMQPLFIIKDVEGMICNFMHYAIDPMRSKTVFPFKHEKIEDSDIEILYSEFPGDLIGFGHLHNSYYKSINNRVYLNPGSLGCNNGPTARFAIIEFHKGECTIQNNSIKYDDTELYKEFEERNVPDRKFIYKTFFGGRFTVK